MEEIQKNITDAYGQDMQKYIDLALEYGLVLLGALAVFVIGRWGAKLLTKMLRNAMTKGKVDETLSSFLANIAYAALLTFVVISALGTLGVNTTSFAAIIAAAGLAIGFALQASLSNFASGVMIIVLKPFTKGDYVELAGTAGTVEEVTIFTTTLKSPDNKIIIVPNGSITSSNIVNFSRQSERRVDMVFGIGYDDDIKLAKDTLATILDRNDKVLKEPAYTIAVGELGDNSVNFVCRPWVKTADYWDVYFTTHEQVKLEFDKVGLTIPFPQQDVHMHPVSANVSSEKTA